MATFSITKSGNVGVTPKVNPSGTATGGNNFSNISISAGGNPVVKPGVQAASPYQNVSPASSSLPANQVSTVKTQPVGNTSTTPVNSTTNVNPNYAMQVQGLGTTNGQTTNTPQGNQQAPSNTGLYGELIRQQASFDPFKNATVSDAYKKAQDINAQLASSRKNQAQAEATNRMNPIPIGDQTGREAVIRNQYLAEQNALSSQLAGQASIYGAGFTGTGQQLQGLGAVTSQAPEALRYDAFGGGGGLSPQVRAQTLAQQVREGLISPQAAEAQLTSLYGGVGSTFLNQALQGGYNYNVGGAQAQAQAANALTGGTAGTTAAQAVFNNAYQTYENLRQSVQNVDQFGALLTQNMGGINPFDVKYANQTLANIRNQLSSAQQAQYDTTLAQLRARISSMLAAGGNQIPTQITNDANMILSGSLPLGSLSQVLQRIEQEGQILLNNQAQIVNENYNRLQSGGQNYSSGSTGSGGLTWDNIGD